MGTETMNRKVKEIPDDREQGRRQTQSDSDNKIAGWVGIVTTICFILGLLYYLIAKFIIPIL